MYVDVHVPVTYTHVHFDMGDTCNMQVYTSKHAYTCRPACNMYVHVPLHHALYMLTWGTHALTMNRITLEPLGNWGQTSECVHVAGVPHHNMHMLQINTYMYPHVNMQVSPISMHVAGVFDVYMHDVDVPMSTCNMLHVSLMHVVGITDSWSARTQGKSSATSLPHILTGAHIQSSGLYIE